MTGHTSADTADAARHRLIVDRIEGDFAVVEIGRQGTIDLPRWLLPAGAQAGDVIALAFRDQSGKALATPVDHGQFFTAQRREGSARRNGVDLDLFPGGHGWSGAKSVDFFSRHLAAPR